MKKTKKKNKEVEVKQHEYLVNGVPFPVPTLEEGNYEMTIFPDKDTRINAKSYVLETYPFDTPIMWLSDLFNFQNELDINISVSPSNSRNYKEELLSKRNSIYKEVIDLENEIKERRRLSKSVIEEMKEKEFLISKYDEMSYHLNKLNNEDNLFDVLLSTTIYEEEQHFLREQINLLNKQLKRKKTNLLPMNFRQKDAYITNLPISNKRIHDKSKILTVSKLTSLFPFYKSYQEIRKDGVLYGEGQNEKPFFLPKFNGDSLGNKVYISGSRGSGQTFHSKLLSLRHLLNGDDIIILSDDREYIEFTKQLGGTVIDEGFKFNIFDIPIENKEKNDNKNATFDLKAVILDKINIISYLIKESNKEVTVEDKIELAEIILEMYQERGITNDVSSLYEERNVFEGDTFYLGESLKFLPTLSDFIEKIEKHERLYKFSPFLKHLKDSVIDGNTEQKYNENSLSLYYLNELTPQEKFLANYWFLNTVKSEKVIFSDMEIGEFDNRFEYLNFEEKSPLTFYYFSNDFSKIASEKFTLTILGKQPLKRLEIIKQELKLTEGQVNLLQEFENRSGENLIVFKNQRFYVSLNPNETESHFIWYNEITQDHLYDIMSI